MRRELAILVCLAACVLVSSENVAPHAESWIPWSSVGPDGTLGANMEWRTANCSLYRDGKAGYVSRLEFMRHQNSLVAFRVHCSSKVILPALSEWYILLQDSVAEHGVAIFRTNHRGKLMVEKIEWQKPTGAAVSELPLSSHGRGVKLRVGLNSEGHLAVIDANSLLGIETDRTLKIVNVPDCIGSQTRSAIQIGFDQTAKFKAIRFTCSS
mmetsp:Transcript_7119/g.12151  ORF Transcript_7119/g.12151 Transcript_7119/m.12151 type:complete len:211 (+) Transcript_7119:24-656(+)|eukprot:CAMPEP_0196652384 /NCGR_PEP_ID=MMETSP1086-20130531/1660_1 /TAXON_ID=77921 /ORGANISM="Cyanoptyche  gloeocystis , Strain SAG4.97" /LENGTH=210 /DNA_ID=CAMNT_0041982901 /DNA_START=11 /DNA_END=643 /DNA_ORIENTATION=+